MSKRWKKRVNQNNKDTMKLSELIAFMMSKYPMTEEEYRKANYNRRTSKADIFNRSTCRCYCYLSSLALRKSKG